MPPKKQLAVLAKGRAKLARMKKAGKAKRGRKKPDTKRKLLKRMRELKK
jgi:hypothetical protein